MVEQTDWEKRAQQAKKIISSFESRGSSTTNVHEVSVLEQLLADIKSYREGGESVPTDFFAKAKYYSRKAYTFLVGGKPVGSPTEMKLKNRQNKLQEVYAGNDKLKVIIRQNKHLLTNEQRRIKSELEQKIAHHSALQEEYLNVKAEYDSVYAVFSQEKFSEQDKYYANQYLVSSKQQLDQLAAEMSTTTDYIALMNESYEQVLIEHAQERTMELFNELQESVLKNNMTILDIYAKREQSGSHEYNLMKNMYELTKTSNLKDLINKERSEVLDKYHRSVENVPDMKSQYKSSKESAQQIIDRMRNLEKKR